MRRSRRPIRTLLALLALSGMSCSGKLEPTQFTNPKFDFGFLERVAVIPLENLSENRQSGVRATRILATELLASGTVDVVEPGEVQAAVDRISGFRNPPSTQHVIDLGRALDVQALIVGSVNQSEVIRSGTVNIPVVTLDLRMLETETGAAVWAGTQTERGATVGARMLGTGGEPISATTRKCVQVLLGTLIQ